MSRREYLRIDKVEKNDQTSSCKTCVPIRCYHNGLYWVCPNPKDERRSTSLNKQYQEGKYIQYTDFFLTINEFNNDANWD